MTDVSVTRNITYATHDGQSLEMDIYRSESNGEGVPVVVYFHGGGFRAGDKSDLPDRMFNLARRGVAVASVNYRLAPGYIFPAAIHDAKAAIRWIRSRGAAYGLNVERVGAWGASAGGYIAAMLGLTAGDPDLEGSVGDDLRESSAVDAVVTWFAPGDLLAASRQSWLEKKLHGEPPGVTLFGRGIPDGDPFVFGNSPVGRAHGDAPPFLIQTGDRDRVVAESEARSLHDALIRNSATSTFQVLGGAGHESERFHDPSNTAMVAAWLKAHLHPEDFGGSVVAGNSGVSNEREREHAENRF